MTKRFLPKFTTLSSHLVLATTLLAGQAIASGSGSGSAEMERALSGDGAAASSAKKKSAPSRSVSPSPERDDQPQNGQAEITTHSPTAQALQKKQRKTLLALAEEGVSLFKEGKSNEAITQYTAALKTPGWETSHRAYANILCNRGYAHFKLKNYEKALVDYVTAQEMGVESFAPRLLKRIGRN